MSCFLLISLRDCLTMVAVMGKGPRELLSPQAKFSASPGDPWVVSLDRVSGFPSKLRSELQVGRASPHHVMPRNSFLHTCAWTFPLLRIPSLSHVSALFQAPNLMSFSS